MDKLYKNLILCGELDYLCLLCEESFQTKEDLDKHLRWENHRKIIKNQQYIPKFKKDCIYKIKNSYYCELCNYVALSSSLLETHLKSKKHETSKASKGSPKDNEPKNKDKEFERDDRFIFVPGGSVLNNKQWNGIKGRVCIVCAVEIQNVVTHLSLPLHMINLIQNTEIIFENEQCYRKTKDNILYCFVCRTIFNDTYLKHITEEDHMDLQAQLISKAVSKKCMSHKFGDVSTKLVQTQSNFYDIDYENNRATCKKCPTVIELDFLAMVEHKKMHPIGKKEDPTALLANMHIDHGKRRSELAKFGKQHQLILTNSGRKGYCMICYIYIVPHMNNFKGHIDGLRHKGLIEIKEGRPPAKKHIEPVETKRDIHLVTKDMVFSKNLGLFWFNGDTCIITSSFFLITEVESNGQLKYSMCYACNTVYPQENDLEHFLSSKHKENFFNCKVLLYTDGEFIRELKNNLYHCGLCNQEIPYWDSVKKHLLNWQHKLAKVDKITLCSSPEHWYDSVLLSRDNKTTDQFYEKLINLHLF